MSPDTPTPANAPETAAQAIHRIFTATLIIGVSGSGKTSLASTFSEYLWETYQQILLLYSWDGGAIPTDVQKRMRQGLIRFWRARTRSGPGLALETLALATKGYWPRRINPATGETAPAVELVAPVTARYAISCPKGHPIKVVPFTSLIVPMNCPTCGPQMLPKEQLRVSESASRTKGFEQIGGVFFDGLTSMCDVVMDEMDSLRGHGHVGGEKSSFGGTITSGSVKFGGNNRADVGFAQGRARQFVGNSLSIPHLVEGPVFTALSQEGTDEGGLTIVSLKLPGSAAAEAGPAWFGNVMETGKIVDDAGKIHHALYLRPYTDKEGRRHLLKTSSSPFGVPEVLIDPPLEDRQPFSVANLGNVFKMLDEDLARALTEQVAGAPGLPAGEMEYGESATIDQPAQTQAAKAPMPQAGRPMAAAPRAAAPGGQATGRAPAATGGSSPAAPAGSATPSTPAAPAAAPVSAPAVRPGVGGGSAPAAPAAANPRPAPARPAAVRAATPAPTASPAAAAPKPSAPPVQAAAPPKVVAPPPPGKPPARAPGS